MNGNSGGLKMITDVSGPCEKEMVQYQSKQNEIEINILNQLKYVCCMLLPKYLLKILIPGISSYSDRISTRNRQGKLKS